MRRPILLDADQTHPDEEIRTPPRVGAKASFALVQSRPADRIRAKR